MIQLRPNQVAAADAVESAFARGINRPLVDSCVGSGKSLTMAEIARRRWEYGERTVICAHTRELVEQNAAACRALGLQVGINAAALGERTWRAPVISAAIQSVYSSGRSFGPIANMLVDECHLIPHSEAGMYRQLYRDLGEPRQPGFSGTTFRLQGGSLVEGEAAPFQAIVYQYGILDGIRDGYLVPAFSGAADDKIDPSKLRKKQGEYSGDSQDAQMLALMDNHIAQMVSHGRDRRAWLVFEATTKAAKAMCARMNEWNIPTGLVLGTTPAGERAQAIAAFRQGRLKALVNVAALTTGFDVQEVDMLVMRRKTMSVGLYIQMTGRLLRTIGGTIEKSVAAGKADGLVLDFAGNIDQHGPLDFIRPKLTAAKLVSCDECGKRNPAAAVKCWSCDEPMTKLCPACLVAIQKGLLDCPHCAHDMRAGERADATGPKLLQTPSGAALIASFRPGSERMGGWLPIRKVYMGEDGDVIVDTATARFVAPERIRAQASLAKWIRLDVAAENIDAVLTPNGISRTTAVQINCEGVAMVVPMPNSQEVS